MALANTSGYHMDQFRRIYKDLGAQWLIKTHEISVLRMKTHSENEPIIIVNIYAHKDSSPCFFPPAFLSCWPTDDTSKIVFPMIYLQWGFYFQQNDNNAPNDYAPVADITV